MLVKELHAKRQLEILRSRWKHNTKLNGLGTVAYEKPVAPRLHETIIRSSI